MGVESEEVGMELLAAVCVGLGLSAASGLRVFLPLLIAGLGQRVGLVDLGGAMAWVSTMPALGVLGLLCVIEMAAYSVPAVDHVLDTLSAPAAWLAGALVAAGLVQTPLHNVLGNLPLSETISSALMATGMTLAGLSGAGAAGVTQIAGASGRLVSSTTTGGLGNPIYGAFESALAGATSILAMLAPVLVGVLGLGLLVLVWRLTRRRAAIA